MRSFMLVAALGAACFVVRTAAADPAPPPPPLPAPDATAPPPPPAVTAAPARPPSTDDDERTANNAIYVEGLGPGLLYSINYERSFGDVAARVGFGYVSVSANSTNGSGGQTHESASLLAIPVTLSYLGVGSKQNILELGAGVTLLHVGAGATSINTNSSTSSSGAATVVFPDLIIGYRHMPPDGGFLFRIGVSPIFGGSAIPVLPLPYLALGGVF